MYKKLLEKIQILFVSRQGLAQESSMCQVLHTGKNNIYIVG